MDQLATPSPFDAIRDIDEHGEFWSARKLMPLCGYTGSSAWGTFERAIGRATAAGSNTGISIDVNFRASWENPSEQAGRPRKNYRLTRHAAYLVVMNCDPRKPEVAAAQSYFAIKTREAEVAPTVTSQPALPATYEEALEALLASVRDKRVLTEQNAVQAAEIKDRNARLMLTAPRAAIYERVMSGDGTYSLADAAKYLYVGTQVEVGQNRLFLRLRDLGWIYDESHGRGARRHWRGDQSVFNKYVVHRMRKPFADPDTGETRTGDPQIRITQKGLDWLMMRPEVLTVDPQDVLPGL